MQNAIRKLSVHGPAALLASFLVLSAPIGASAALLFSEDFEGHANGSTVATANGWTGAIVNVNDSAHFGGSRVLDGTDASGTVDGFATIERGLGGTLDGAASHRMSVDVYAQTASLPSHNNGLGMSASGGASAFNGGVYWSVLYDLNNVSGATGYVFDARSMTGNSSDFFLLNGPFDSVQTFEIVLDGLGGEVYGVYDFGSGTQETTRFTVSAAEIAAIDQVFGFFDFRSANPGGVFASTGRGTQFGGAEWDNLSVNGSFEAVPEPAMSGLLCLGVAGMFAVRRRRRS
jgi:hypothetical protein